MVQDHALSIALAVRLCTNHKLGRTETQRITDIVLSEFYVNKQVLSAASPVFQAPRQAFP